MKRFLLVMAFLPLLLTDGTASAMSVTDDVIPEKIALFYSRLGKSCVNVSYSYTLKTAESVVTGEGKACVQGNMYRLTMNGMEFYNDGSTLWAVDRDAEEIVVDSVSMSGRLLDNPVLFVSGMEYLFDIREDASGFYDRVEYMRETVNRVTLLPKEESDVLSVDVYYNADFTLIKGSTIYMKDGTVTDVTIPSMKFMPLKDKSYFVFDTSSAGESYIISDMR